MWEYNLSKTKICPFLKNPFAEVCPIFLSSFTICTNCSSRLENLLNSLLLLIILSHPNY